MSDINNEMPENEIIDTAENTETVTNEEVQEQTEEVREIKGAEEASAQDLEEAKANEDEKKKLFGKKKDKKDKKDTQIEELTDRLKRSMAEFDNFRKRTEKEKSQMYEVGAKSVVEKILPVVDNFERGLAMVPEEEKENPFVDGMDKIYKQLMANLEEIGVKPIEAVGNQFDPNLHNAVMHIEDEAFGENTVAEEFQKGYIYRETVVRHSMVKVAN
ncbi:nucleotide exchange factor GrpE [Anaerobium acetethylicum]|uniref:Protein GrpE n=1 Tax=Anaerobium acetethylicum TaxID=1619234 RepID=A0A1D3TQS1_9FIRM|nr:nucleotide exchange factor GrpE [Anaerobium acetethylicum]SCP95979.1 molecular chaperone GrpE [Anaerobium acetethylicum]